MQRSLMAGLVVGMLLFSTYESQSEVNGAAALDPSVAHAIEFENTLVGAWVSLSDENYTVSFEANGETSDFQNGNETVRGTWHVAHDDSSPTGLVLRKDLAGARYVYSVLGYSENELSLSFLPRGNTLNFRRR